MIGAQILIWGIENHTQPHWSAFYHYLWDSNIGHCALKLTIPSNPDNDSLVYHACKDNKGKTRIPYIRIKREIGDQTEHFWVVYFSWWPGNKLQEEYNDRLSANLHLQVEYNDRWQEYFLDTMEPATGIVRDYFGAIYDFIYGTPKPIPKPIESIMHNHPNTAELTALLQKKETDLSVLKESLMSKVDAFFVAQSRHERLGSKNRCLKNERKNATINALLKDTNRQLILVEKELNALDEDIQLLWETYKRLIADLKILKREYYHEIATIGARPQIISLPLGEHLSYKKLLDAMHTIATGAYPFDIMFFNCAGAVREIVAAALSERAKSADFKPHLLDTPLKLHHSACLLQKKLLDLRTTEDPNKIPILPSYRLAAAKAASLPVIQPAPDSRWYLKPS